LDSVGAGSDELIVEPGVDSHAVEIRSCAVAAGRGAGYARHARREDDAKAVSARRRLARPISTLWARLPPGLMC
jgi:hypothetical protein